MARTRREAETLAAAVAEFQGALEENPEDPMALKFLETLKYRVN